MRTGDLSNPHPSKPSRLSRSEIEQKARSILLEHDLLAIPVDPVALANALGVKVNNAKFSEPGISGLIASRAGSCSILVERDDPPMRKRFTIAHELGHLFLHLSDGSEFVDATVDMGRSAFSEEGSPSPRIEVEANQFAAALLMPEDSVRRLFAEVKDVADLARVFRVSPEAMSIRLDTLNLSR